MISPAYRAGKIRDFAQSVRIALERNQRSIEI